MQPPRRWWKSPDEVVEQLHLLLEGYRRRHQPDAAEVVEDIFTDVLDRVTGFCAAQAAWTEPVVGPADESAPR